MTTPSPSGKSTTMQSRGSKIAIAGLLGSLIITLFPRGILIGLKSYGTWSAQMAVIKQAQVFVTYSNPKEATELEALLQDRKKLEGIRDSLQKIPNSFGSPYTEAQATLAKVQSHLKMMNQQIGVDEATSREWETAFQLGRDAINSVHEPPLSLEIWKKAKADLDQSIKILSSIPSHTPGYNQVKEQLADDLQKSLVITKMMAEEEKAVNTVKIAEKIAKQAAAITSGRAISELTDLQKAQAMWEKAILPLKQVPTHSYANQDAESHIASYARNSQEIVRAITELNQCKKDSSTPFTCSVSLMLEEPASSN